LNVETRCGGSSFEIANYNAFGGDCASDRGGKSTALDGIDGSVVCANIIRCKANYKVENHIVRRIVSILIADLVSQYG